MKTKDELKTLLEQIKNKGYLLKDYSLTEYDIKDIISNNLKKCRDEAFYKYNTENLKNDSPEQFNIYNIKKIPIEKYYKDKFKDLPQEEINDLIKNSRNEEITEETFKDFAEIEAEIKKHFNKRTDSEILNRLTKEVYLKFELNGVWRYDVEKKSFEEIKNILEQEHKKELIFSNHFGSYSFGRDTAEKMQKIQRTINLILKEDFLNLDLNNIEYNEDLKSIETKINEQQQKIKVRIFGNNKLKIRFSDDTKFKKVRKFFIDTEFNRYTKEVYFLSDTLRDSEIKELGHFALYENKENSFINIKMNYKTLMDYKKRYPKTTFFVGRDEQEKQDLKYIYSFGRDDTWRIDTLKNKVDESRLNEYAKQRTKDLIKRFFL